jgi:uncharacterized membrane protein required for colicin V production
VTKLDWIIIAFAAILAAFGFRQGFIVGVLSFVGFAAGAFLGTRLGPLLLPHGSASPYAPAFGLIGALLGGAVLASGLEGLGFMLRRTLVLPGLGVLDGILGAALGAALALGIVWIIAAVLIGADVAVIVLGSLGMVSSAVALGGHWGLSGALIGVLVLGPLTSIPNAQTAIRLGLLSRGAALVSETFASNTINLLGGVMVPALFVQVASHSRSERFGLLWLAAMTAICILGLARREGIDRRWGGTLVALYGGFVAFQLLS